MEIISDDENHQNTFRIYGLPNPYRPDEATNKLYVDQQIAAGGGGGSSGIIDGGSPSTDYTDGPIIDCGEVT